MFMKQKKVLLSKNSTFDYLLIIPWLVKAKELISYHIPSGRKSSSGEKLLSLMEEHKCAHLPIVDDKNYLGIVSEDEIYEMDESTEAIENLGRKLIRPFVNENGHIYEVISLVNDFRITTIPVLNSEEEYLGVISIQDLALNFAKITNVNEPGGILILEVNNKDYSLAQAAQIVESDNAKILSSYIYGNSNSSKLDLVLKINEKDLSSIISAFSRYKYIIKSSFHESRFNEDLKDRYNQFMKYLNM